MITITRRQARRLRAVFRRHALGIAHKGVVPPIVFRADPAGLHVRHHQAAQAVECLLPGNDRPEDAIALPLDALADFEGKDDTPIVLEAAAPGRTVVRWDDRGIPQSREYPVPDLSGLPPFPATPTATEACPADLLDALAEAAATTDEGSTRYALDCLQLKGDTGEVVATDGRQILIQGGYGLPWDGDLLVRRTPLFSARELPRDRPVEVGRTDTHVVLRAGSWTIWLSVRADARFPRIEHAVPAAQAAATRLRLAPEDAQFLGRSLDRLPGGDAPNAPVTVDLNGKVAVRAQAGGEGRVTELVLGRSGFTGEPVRFNTNRQYLARALRLGFAEVQVVGPEEPVACRDGRRAYLWQPLSRESALGPSDDSVRIDSVGNGLPVEPVETPKKEKVPMVDTAQGPRPGAALPAATHGVASGGGSGGLMSVIQEAEALHQSLADAKARTHRLIGALRRERKRSRLVQSTLATLRQIRLQEAVE
jgi:hypothetical protein